MVFNAAMQPPLPRMGWTGRAAWTVLAQRRNYETRVIAEAA
jgi:hypothetical protein